MISSVGVDFQTVVRQDSAQAREIFSSQATDKVTWKNSYNALLEDQLFAEFSEMVLDIQGKPVRAGEAGVPSIETFKVAMSEYYHLHPLQYNESKKIRHSDYIDLVHMIYMVHSDIFRSDGDIADVARGVAERAGCKVLPKIEELLLL